MLLYYLNSGWGNAINSEVYMKTEDELREDFELLYVNNGNNSIPRPSRSMCGQYWSNHIESRWVAFKFAYNLYTGA